MAISRVVSEMFNVETYRDLGRRSLMVIGTDTYRSVTYDFPINVPWAYLEPFPR